jgi:hypothetical protein
LSKFVEGVQVYVPVFSIVDAIAYRGFTLLEGPRRRTMVTVPDVVGDHVIVKGSPAETTVDEVGSEMGLQLSVHKVVYQSLSAWSGRARFI